MSITPKPILSKLSTLLILLLSQNPKTGSFRELFLPENNFKTSSTVNFPRKHLHFGGLETNQRQEIPKYTIYEVNTISLFKTIPPKNQTISIH